MGATAWQYCQKHMTRIGEFREVLFWLLLLGSWQFLASPGGRNAVVGTSGAAFFLLFAFRNLGRLTRLGLEYANWRPTSSARWALGAASGIIAGIVIFGIGSASGQSMMLSSNWSLAFLQITLGPVLEEVVFRGYLFSVLIWLLHRAAGGAALNWLVIVMAAVIFALVHLAQPGVSWLQLVCITMTGGCMVGSGSCRPRRHRLLLRTQHTTSRCMESPASLRMSPCSQFEHAGTWKPRGRPRRVRRRTIIERSSGRRNQGLESAVLWRAGRACGRWYLER